MDMNGIYSASKNAVSDNQLRWINNSKSRILSNKCLEK